LRYLAFLPLLSKESPMIARCFLLSAALAFALGAVASPGPAEARGCVKGAIGGGIAGH